MIKAGAKPLSTIVPQVNIPQIRIKHQYLGELTTASRNEVQKPTVIITELKNRLNKVFGKEIFRFQEEESKLFGTLLEVEPEYRQKAFRFGEILRLSGIMTIMENCIKTFEIYSKNSAIYFHSKYKFEPAITEVEECKKALESVITNCKNGYETLKAEAEELLKKSELSQTPESQRGFCSTTNAFLKKYIQKVLETKDEYKKHPFKNGMKMILNNKNIEENKTFFNSLFEKYNINYRI